jgi:C4-dicarboxylate-specific signal transduction histidine kinase
VNQPLAAIVAHAATCLQWLSEGQLDVEQAREAAQHIVQDGHHAGAVLASIRALARKAAPTMAELDLNSAILEMLVLLRAELRRHGIAAETSLATDAGHAVGDRVQIQQVILNLIMNGMEAIRVSEGQPKLLRIATQRQQPGFILVTVADTGVGLTPMGTEKIFDAFFTTKPEGIGLGLSICRSIVEAHGGRLWASANSPGGCVFNFTVRAFA